MVEELDGLGVEGEAVEFLGEEGGSYLVEEELDGLNVDAEDDALEHGDVVADDLLVGEVEVVADDLVHRPVGEEVVWG